MRLVIALGMCALLLVGCEKPVSQSGGTDGQEMRRFQVKGILRAINFADHEVTIEHQEIPDYMPEMTMPFTVKDMAEVQALSVGDALQFEFIVTKGDSWITGIQKVDAAAVRLAHSGLAAAAENAERLKEGDPLPDFQLTDDQGRAIKRATFEGKPLVLTFIFTRCPVPNFCPRMSGNFAALVKATANDPKLRDTNLLSVTIDPDYDTPQILTQYAESYRGDAGDRWRFGTGARDQVGKLTAAFAVQVKPENGTLVHGLATALIDRHGKIRKIWRGHAWEVEEVLAELAKL